jgi:8-oxo-dGTP diphosphatase
MEKIMPAPATPALTVDIIIELLDSPNRPIVLIERKHPPHGWAIPGGFVDIGERVERAAVREAQEETSLAVRLVTLLGVYSDPARDPRSHTASAVYIAEARGVPEAQDDAKAVGVFMPAEIPSALAFDHARILRDYLRYRETGERPPPAP